MSHLTKGPNLENRSTSTSINFYNLHLPLELICQIARARRGMEAPDVEDGARHDGESERRKLG